MSRLKTTGLLSVVLFCVVGAMLSAYGQEKKAPQLTGEKGTLYIDRRPLPSAAEAGEKAARMAAAEAASLPAPLSETFQLHSRPGADHVLYLDFDGHHGQNGKYKAFNFEGNPQSGFSDNELTVIQETWRSVAEDFLPFDLDVTTEDPGVEALIKTDASDTQWGQRAVITDGSAKYSWAYRSFNWDTDQEAYCWSGDNTWLWIADSIAHEVGHTLGLSHDGRGGQGYYTGHGSGETEWCPIMGWGAYSLNQWDDGEYNGTTNPNQDDLNKITTTNGFGFRADDHGSSTGAATPITLPGGALAFVAEGIIEQRTDVDYFAFTASGGNVQFSINEDVVLGASNLDLVAKIHDSGGAVLHTSNPVNLITASFDVNLPAGNYYLSIDGVGMGDPSTNPPTGYSDYGSLGYYSIYGSDSGGTSDTDPPTPDPMTFATAPVATGSTSISMAASTATDPSGVEYYFTNTAGGGNDSGWQDGDSYSDTGLTPDTQYTYTVTARDKSAGQNMTAPSAPASATTDSGGGCTPTDMHISAVVCAEVNCGQGKKNGRTTVTIIDDCGNPVAGALVDVTFAGDFSENVSNVATDANGQAVITSSGCIKKPSFTVTVTDVTGALPYDPSDDVVGGCSG